MRSAPRARATAAAAEASIAKLVELRDKLAQAKDAYWSKQVDIQRQTATAWLLFSQGKQGDALKAMSVAADAEDKSEKHPVTPGVPKPARELYGEMMLDSGMPKEALAAFEATLLKEPTGWAPLSALPGPPTRPATPPRPQGISPKVVAIGGDADKTRTEIDEARSFLAKR